MSNRQMGRFWRKAGLFKLVIGIALSAIGSVAVSPSAQASLKLCNETSYMLQAAIAQKANKKWKVEGWWTIQPGTCATAIKDNLREKDFYTFARSIPGHVGGVKAWGGRYFFCTGSDTFSLDNPPNCEQEGLQLLGFARVETDGSKDWTDTFTETAEYDDKKARIAGVQRLLKDIGYDRVGIDGYMGRQTRLAITKFKKENKLPDGEALTNELFDALARVANAQVQKAGLELCNSTDFDLFAAVADNVDSPPQFVSRGWYQIAKGQCKRVIKDPLTKSSYFAYAEVDLPNGDFYAWGGARGFCVNDIRFSINSEGSCMVRGYAERRFVEVATEGKTHTRYYFTMDNYSEPELPPALPEAEDAAEVQPPSSPESSGDVNG
ncbi:MAG: DUF1036 domain-containing protein [Alphaproteobacteria bacterium]|nr:MAG: DUF1036 domain-containing protein [Alphaproteobacteria bacterium]